MHLSEIFEAQNQTCSKTCCICHVPIVCSVLRYITLQHLHFSVLFKFNSKKSLQLVVKSTSKADYLLLLSHFEREFRKFYKVLLSGEDFEGFRLNER